MGLVSFHIQEHVCAYYRYITTVEARITVFLFFGKNGDEGRLHIHGSKFFLSKLATIDSYINYFSGMIRARQHRRGTSVPFDSVMKTQQ